MTASAEPLSLDQSRSASATVSAPRLRTKSIHVPVRAIVRSTSNQDAPAIRSTIPIRAPRAIVVAKSIPVSPAPSGARSPMNERAGQAGYGTHYIRARAPGTVDAHRSPGAGHGQYDTQPGSARAGVAS